MMGFGYNDTPEISQNLFGIGSRNTQLKSLCLSIPERFAKTQFSEHQDLGFLVHRNRDQTNCVIHFGVLTYRF